MAFGAFRGPQAGGWPGISQGGLSNMFAGFGEGLMELAKSWNEHDLAQKKLDYETGRDAANHAFEMNLHRFEQGEQTKREQESQAAQTQRERESRASQEKISGASLEEMKRQHDAQMRMEGARVGMEGERLKFEQTRSDAAEKRAQTAEDRAAEGQRKNQFYEQLRSLNDENKADTSTLSGLEKELQHEGEDDARAELKNQIATLRSNITQRQDAAARLREQVTAPASKAASFSPADDAFSGGGDKGGMIEQIEAGAGAGAAPSGDGNGRPPLADDYQKVYEAFRKANPNMPEDKAYDYIKSKSQNQINNALGASKAQASTQAPDNGQFVSDDGSIPQSPDQSAPSAPAQALASAQPPPAAPPAPQTAPDDTSGADEQPQQDSSAVAAKLQQTPGGQAVFASLQRLAGEKPGPAADKLRRAAEIGISQEMPDVDASSFIDDYLSQQQEAPEDQTAEMA